MKKLLLLNLIITMVLISSACSYSVNFVVLNHSNEQIEVEYTLKNPGLDGESTPFKMSQDEWNRWFGESKWRQISQDEYRFNTETKKITVKAAPNEVVRILSMSDGIYFVENYEHFQVTNIKISGKNGTIIYEGNQLYKQFEEKNYTNRFIIYK